jgi:opacity protein-like surface antigen
MKRFTAATLLSLFVAPTCGFAADLASAPLTQPEPAALGDLAEVGTNWYIRGDMGFSFDTAPTLTYPNLLTPPPAGLATVNNAAGFGSSNSTHNFNIGIGAGFRYNDYLRFDATYEYRTGAGTSRTDGGIVCPFYAAGLTSQGANPLLLGYSYDTNQTCNSYLTLKQHNDVALANAYVDLGTYWGITPYVGAGAGLDVNSASGTLNYLETANGQPYRADLSPTGAYPFIWLNPISGRAINPQPNIPFAPQNWDRKINSTTYSLAIALMAGVGIQLTPSATLDLNYRYLSLGTTKLSLNNGAGAVITSNNSAQDLRVGIRYLLN